MISLANKISRCLSANHNPELWCVICICTSDVLFALVLHLNCNAPRQSESSIFLMCIIMVFTKCRLRIKTVSRVIHDNVIYMYVTAKESLWTLVADCRRIPYLQCTVAGNKKLKNSPSSKILYIKLTSSITASPLPWDFCGWTYLILESPLRTVPTFVSAHTFCASRKPWFKRALGLVLTQSTTPPSTWVMTKIKIFLLWPNLFWWNYA